MNVVVNPARKFAVVFDNRRSTVGVTVAHDASPVRRFTSLSWFPRILIAETVDQQIFALRRSAGDDFKIRSALIILHTHTYSVEIIRNKIKSMSIYVVWP